MGQRRDCVTYLSTYFEGGVQVQASRVSSGPVEGSNGQARAIWG